MKSIIWFLLFYCLLQQGVEAQSYRKYWTDGKLSWDDFQERMTDEGSSELRYYFGYSSSKKRFHDTTLIRLSANSYMDRKWSWVNPEFKNEWNLRFNQCLFDISEKYRRNLQERLDQCSSMNEIELTAGYAFRDAEYEIKQFKKESGDGRDSLVIEKWESKLYKELSLTATDAIPEFSKSRFAYGIQFGLGAGFYSGSLGDHFNSSFNMLFGFDFAYRKLTTFLNFSLGFNKVKQEYLTGSFYPGQSINVAILDWSLGYPVLDNAKWKLIPFAGFGYTEFSKARKDYQERYVLSSNNFLFGLNVDYKYRKMLNIGPNLFWGIRLKEFVEYSVRSRIYITRASYFDNLNGYTINFSIGICGFGNLIKVIK